jgi:hypothetical protein
LTAPVLIDYSFQFGATGYVIGGAPFADGTLIDVTSVTGLDQAPIRTSTATYEGRDGGILNATHEDMRVVIISGIIYGGSSPVQTLLEALKANYAPSSLAQPFYIQPGGITQRQIYAKSLGFKYPWDAGIRTNKVPFTITLQAEDPTIYGTSLYDVAGALQGAAPGYGFNYNYPYSYGTSTFIGQTYLVNNGTKPCGFYAIIRNPTSQIVNPRILSDTVSAQVTTTISAGSNDVLIFDFYRESLLLNNANRHTAIVNEGWFLLQPGINSVRFQADSTAQVNVDYQFYDGYR